MGAQDLILSPAQGTLAKASKETFPGGEPNGKKTEKLQKRLKIALLGLFQGRATENKTKNSKKRPKIALLSLYLFHV